MKKFRKFASTICYNRDITFSVDDTVYAGKIQLKSNYGATISARNPLNLSKGKRIWINILSQKQKEVKSAEVVWFDESGFGAKFLKY
ncbi:MAG: hypothetical protein KJO26_11075 [Deltaproteobacteria bacterium]|nr:hypothetical protein [Deltaproteobacteria bacterium]